MIPNRVLYEKELCEVFNEQEAVVGWSGLGGLGGGVGSLELEKRGKTHLKSLRYKFMQFSTFGALRWTVQG